MSGRNCYILFFSVIAGLILAGVGSCSEARWVQASGIILAGAGAAASMVDTYREGVIETNWGTIRRAESPVLFQIEAAFWSALIACWTIGGVLCSLGVIGHRK